MNYRGEIKLIEEYSPDNKQEQYYNRICNFIKSDNHILVNPGGMGLGKTIASAMALKHNLTNQEFGFIGCPTSPLKSVWSKDMNLLGLRKDHMIWFAKSDCCIKLMQNSNFDIKDCKDDCEFWSRVECNGEPKEEMFKELEKIESEMPFYPNKYYKDNGCSKCLLPCSRYGMRKKKYIIGDYFGFLNPKAFNSVINNRNTLNKSTLNGTLIIDEAHLLPDRAKDFLSKTINFTKIIKKLKEEIQCDYINRNPKLISPWNATIKRLESVHELVKLKGVVEGRFDYEDFVDCYENNRILNSFNYTEFIIQLKNLISEQYKINPTDFDNPDDPHCKRLLSFIDLWEQRQDDINYKKRFQYLNFHNETLRFVIDCCDTSNFIASLFKKWNKVILNSGTIPDKEFFCAQTGIKIMKTVYERLIESYSIKDNVIIYPVGNFTAKNGNRERTYNEQSETLNKVVGNLHGRTIIYIQAKYNSRALINNLQTNKKIIDFCSKDDGFEIKKHDFERLTSEFNNSNNAIAIMNINGRVEGFNFESAIDESSVDNIIIFGYPFAKRGMAYEDMLEYYANIMKDRTLAIKWLDYSPVLNKIHQAACRAKRKRSDNPVIILWDSNFGKRAGSYMPDDMKGMITYEENILIKNICNINKRCLNGLNI